MADPIGDPGTGVPVWSGPLVVHADGRESLAERAAACRSWIDEALREHGAVLFRGFGIDSAERFRHVSEILCTRLLDYVYRSTPRTTVDANIYTATEYRADATIPQHNENAYQRDWPMKLVFCCLQPADSGGRTPLAHTAHVTRRLGRDVMHTFRERRVMYVRNFGQGVDLPWTTTFQTESKADVEAYCRHEDITCTWLDDDRLRTTQVCQGTARHPVTGDELWFNQAHLFHVSALAPEHRAMLLELFAEDELPRNSYFGDGGQIAEPLLARIRHAYDAELVHFTWERGDVLLVDNMLVSHGREPFTGRRQVLVAMGEPFSAAVQACGGGVP